MWTNIWMTINNKQGNNTKIRTTQSTENACILLPWYAADQNPAAAEYAVAEEWWCICWVEEDLGDDVSLLFIFPIPTWQLPIILFDITPSELLGWLAAITLLVLLDTLEELMLTLLFVTFPVQSSVDPIYIHDVQK